MLPSTSIEFFVDHRAAFLALHLLGVALGMGGATITDILFFNFLTDFRISRKEADVMRILSNVILSALGILYLSGAALYLADVPRLSVSSAFLSKAVIVVILTVNGIVMHKWIAPHMVHLSFLKHPFESHHIMHRLRAVAFATGAISFTSWYSVFLIAMMKSYFPEWFTMAHILSVYGAVLSIALVCSQLLQRHFHKKCLVD